MKLSKEVDWSKSPEGATHYNAKCVCPWLKETPASYFAEDKKVWVKYNSNAFAMYDLRNAVKRPQEWDGSGVPPVGTVCEYRVNEDEWVSGEVFGHRVCPNGDVQLFVSLNNSWDFSSALDRFRPIKTPEQTALEERLHAINEMHRVILESRTKTVAALYDAGYRKAVVRTLVTTIQEPEGEDETYTRYSVGFKEV